MGNTNYFSGVVKILENPKESLIKEKIPCLRFKVALPQPKKNRIVSVMFWGNLAREVNKYYRKKDYILIEGYVSARKQSDLRLNPKKAKDIVITALRVYPIFLVSKGSNPTPNQVSN